MKMLQALKQMLIGMGILSAGLFITAGGYYLANREIRTDWLPPETPLLIQLPALRFLSSPAGRRVLRTLLPVTPATAVLFHELQHLQKSSRQVLQGLLPVLEAPAILWLNRENRLSMIVDTGWRSLFYSGGLFAVRSVFSSGDRYRIDHTENSSAQGSYLLYRISLLEQGIEVYMAKFGNLLILSESRGELLQCLAARESGNNLGNRPGAEEMFDELPPRRIKLIKPGRAAADWLAALLPATYRPLLQKIPLTGITAEFIPGKRVLQVQGTIRFNLPESSRTGAGIRLLHSNRYRPAAIGYFPSETLSGVLFCVDDLVELQRLCTPASNRSADTLNIWNGSEFGYFTVPVSNSLPAQIFYMQTLHPVEAAAGLDRQQKKPVEQLPAALASALQLKTGLRYYYRRNRLFFFGDDRPLLRSQMKLSRGRLGFKPILSPGRCNLFVFWKEGRFGPRFGQLSALFNSPKGALRLYADDGMLYFDARFANITDPR